MNNTIKIDTTGWETYTDAFITTSPVRRLGATTIQGEGVSRFLLHLLSLL